MLDGWLSCRFSVDDNRIKEFLTDCLRQFEDLLKSEESQIPDLIVVDEDVDDKPDETKKSSSELRTDCPVVDIFADEDLPDLEVRAFSSGSSTQSYLQIRLRAVVDNKSVLLWKNLLNVSK